MTAPDLTAQLAESVLVEWTRRHAQRCGILRHGHDGSGYRPCVGDSPLCGYPKPVALVDYEQTQQAPDKRICPGCDTSLTQCQEWRKNGAVACCPDCKHPPHASSSPETINLDVVNAAARASFQRRMHEQAMPCHDLTCDICTDLRADGAGEQSHVTTDGDCWAALQPDRPCRAEGAGEPKRVFSCGCTDNGSFCVRPDHGTGEYGKPPGRSTPSKRAESHRWRITFSYYVGPGYRLDDHVVPGESLEAALAGFHQHALKLFGVGKFHTLSVALADDAVPRVE